MANVEVPDACFAVDGVGSGDGAGTQRQKAVALSAARWSAVDGIR